MGLFSRKKPKTQNSLSTSRSILWGATMAGTYVNEQTALQTSAVYACVRIISEALASLPLHIYRSEEEGSKIVPEHHLYLLLHDEPNPEMTSFLFRETLMSHILLYGNAYAQIIRDGGGRVTALYPLLPNKMDVSRGESGEIYYTYWRERDESHPGGVLEHSGTVSKPEKLHDAWELIHKGVQNSGKVAVLEDWLKYHPIAVPPEQAQFLETQKFQLNEIARIFRIPPHIVGDLEKSSFSNIEQQSLEFVKYTMEPWVIRWEQCMKRSLILPSEKSHSLICR